MLASPRPQTWPFVEALGQIPARRAAERSLSCPISRPTTSTAFESRPTGFGPRAVHTGRVPSTVRSTFAGAARCFAGLVGHLPGTAWDGAGLGEWDLRSLVGHTGRAVSTVATYLQRPAAEERVPSAARYYALLRQQNVVDHSAVAERGRQAGSGLGPQPARTVHTLVEETLLALDAVTGDPLIDTFVGGMRLSAYLPTRTFELTVHSLDIAAASGLEVTLPPQALGDALHLAIDVALICGDGQTLLRALTGRRPLPNTYSIV